MKRTLSLLVLGTLLPICSWAVDTPTNTATTPTGGVYLGYYQEDPLTNPEDPTMGSVYLNLPAANSNFSGTMYFTYFGCQHSNEGSISGAKNGAELHGTWNGGVDGTQQNGSFVGAYTAAKNAYAGTYTVAGGKQHVDVPNCISYYIAPKGTFELFAVGQNTPSSFNVNLDGREVRWTPASGAMMTLVFVLDPVVAASGHGNATIWQTLVPAASGSVKLDQVHLAKGHNYVVAVSTADNKFRRLGFASKPFVAP